MIHHAVYLSLPAQHDTSELANIMESLAALVGVIAGFNAFHHGPNIDLEAKSPEAAYGFTGVFSDKAAVLRYAVDPRHKALGGRLVALCGGADRIKVYDIDAGGS